MKKFRKIMAVLVAAMMIMATMVPAWASGNADSGRLDDLPRAAAGEDPGNPGTNTGTITINNAEDGETYTAYRILDLYSFTDDDNRSNQHTATTEHYAYMIDSASPWFNFIKKWSDQQTTADGNAGCAQYFSINMNDPFVIDDSTEATATGINVGTYYFVSATDTFKALVDEVADPYTSRYEASTDTDADHDYGWLINESAGVAYNKVQTFARAAREYAAVAGNNVKTNENLAKYAYQKTSSSGTEAAGSTTGAQTGKVKITFSDVKLGYYLVDSSIGTMVALDTTNRTVTMYDKNLSPTLEKKVKLRKYDHTTRTDNSYGASKSDYFGDNTNYEIGETATFVTTITVPKGSGNWTDQTDASFVLHDVMEKGFTLNADSIKVYVDDLPAVEDNNKLSLYEASKTEAQVTTNYFTLDTPGQGETRLGNGSSFEITFLKPLLDKVVDGGVIEVEYTATLNENAYVLGDLTKDANKERTSATAPDAKKTTIRGFGDSSATIEGGPANPGDTVKVEQIFYNANEDNANTNSAILTYGLRSATPWDAVTVETYQFDLVKTKDEKESVGATNYPYDLLEGAKFELYRSTKKDGEPQNEATTPAMNTSDKVHFSISGNTYTVSQDSNDETTLTSAKHGQLNIRGLEAGHYYLKETYAPTGFHVLDGYIEVVVHGDASNGTTALDSTYTIGTDNNDGKITYTYLNPAKAGQDKVVKAAVGPAWGEADVKASGDNNVADTYKEGGLHVINTTTTELPSTGGMGTTVLYIVGGMLVILAGAYLFFSRKRTA